MLSGDVTLERATRAAQDLTNVLWETQAASMAAAATACVGLAPGIGRYLRTQATRARFAHNLTDTNLPDGWTVTVAPSRMCKVTICGPDVLVRYLKENRSGHPGGVPAAGRTRARREFWTQGSLFSGDPAAPAVTNLLLLWDYSATPDEGFTLRLVHPTGAGCYGSRTPIDLALDLLPGPGLEQGLVFRGGEDDADLFAIIDAEDLDQRDGS